MLLGDLTKYNNSPAVDYAFHVEHGHNLEDVLVPQRSGCRLISQQVRESTVHYPTCVALARVNAGR